MLNYWQKLQDPRWQKKRLHILNRDKFTCRACGATDKTLHVHHCQYQGDPWDVNPTMLLTLCAPCHEARGALEKDIRRALETIMSWMTEEQLRGLLGSVEDAGMDYATDIRVVAFKQLESIQK